MVVVEGSAGSEIVIDPVGASVDMFEVVKMEEVAGAEAEGEAREDGVAFKDTVAMFVHRARIEQRKIHENRPKVAEEGKKIRASVKWEQALTAARRVGCARPQIHSKFHDVFLAPH